MKPEGNLIKRISGIVRICVIFGWSLIVLAFLLKGVFPHAGKPTFWIFQVVAVFAAISLVAEGAEACAGRTSFGYVVVDTCLTLPMFVFWFFVRTSTG